MTRITNRLNLPLPIVEAIKNDPYDNQGTTSVTTLLSPVQATALRRQHADEIVEDAADRLWALFGQIGHLAIERGATNLNPDVWISERRFFGDFFGHTVSGQVDLIHVPGKVVYDSKFTSGWAVKDALQKGKDDWRIQLSLLALLARHNGIEIEQGKIIAIIRDWTELQAERNDWPPQPIAVIDMKIMSEGETLTWLRQRLEALDRALAGEYVPCTDEERWANPGGFAVYKDTNKRATKVEPTREALDAYLARNPVCKPRIEERPATYRRCEKYCSAAAFCPQHQATQATQAQQKEAA